MSPTRLIVLRCSAFFPYRRIAWVHRA